MPLHHAFVRHGQVDMLCEVHDLWMLVDQDCDLAWSAITGSTDQPFLVELRPVFEDDPPADWGIRSHRFRIDAEGHHLRSGAPAVRATPDVVVTSEHVECLDPDHLLRLKTWLGHRYDRPAVPQRYVSLAKALASALSAKSRRSAASHYRDVLAQFWDDSRGTRYSLVAVIPGGRFEATSEEVQAARVWLAEAVREVPSDLGVPESLDGYGDEDVSLRFVEESFSLDLSKLSWPPNQPGPLGA